MVPPVKISDIEGHSEDFYNEYSRTLQKYIVASLISECQNGIGYTENDLKGGLTDYVDEPNCQRFIKNLLLAGGSMRYGEFHEKMENEIKEKISSALLYITTNPDISEIYDKKNGISYYHFKRKQIRYCKRKIKKYRKLLEKSNS